MEITNHGQQELTSGGGAGASASGKVALASPSGVTVPSPAAYPKRFADWTDAHKAQASADHPEVARFLLSHPDGSKQVWRRLGERKDTYASQEQWDRSKAPADPAGRCDIDSPVSAADAFAHYCNGGRLAFYPALLDVLCLELDINGEGASFVRAAAEGNALAGFPKMLAWESGGFHQRGHAHWSAPRGEGGVLEAKAIKHGVPRAVKGIDPRRYIACYDMVALASTWNTGGAGEFSRSDFLAVFLESAPAPEGEGWVPTIHGGSGLRVIEEAKALDIDLQERHGVLDVVSQMQTGERNDITFSAFIYAKLNFPDDELLLDELEEAALNTGLRPHEVRSARNSAERRAERIAEENDEFHQLPLDMAVEADAEPAPIAEDDGPAPFPLDALPEDVQTAVAALWHTSSAPLDSICVAALGAMNIPTAAQFDVESGSGKAGQNTMPTSLYLAMLANTGVGKSDLGVLFSGLEEYSQQCLRDYTWQHAQWKKEREGGRRNEEGEQMEEPVNVMPAAGPSDTGQAIAAALSWHNPFLYELDLDAYEGLGSRDDGYVYLSRRLFSGEATQMTRKGRAGVGEAGHGLSYSGVPADRRMVKVHALQPEFAAETLLSQENAANGLAARYLIARFDMVEKFGADMAHSREAVNRFATLVAVTLRKFNHRGQGAGGGSITRRVIGCPDHILVSAFQKNNANRRNAYHIEPADKIYAGWLKRKVEHTRRVAATLAHWDWEQNGDVSLPPTITEKVWERAERIVDFFEQFVSRPEQDVPAPLARLSAQHGTESFTKSEAYKAFPGRARGKTAVMEALSTWVEMGLLNFEERTLTRADGRRYTRTTYSVAPAARDKRIIREERAPKVSEVEVRQVSLPKPGEKNSSFKGDLGY